MAEAPTFMTVAQEFTKYYYQTFDNNRDGLAPLYRETSLLTFENAQHEGVEEIMEKLKNLPFEKIIHQTTTIDAQPAGPNGSIIVMITGGLLPDGSEHPLNFSQTFHLIPDAGTYYVQNDIFRLVYLG